MTANAVAWIAAMSAAVLGQQAHPTGALTAHDVLARAEQALHNARTYQATIFVVSSNSPMGSFTLRTDVKTVGWKKVWARTGLASNDSGRMNYAITALAQNVQVVFDGKTISYYLPALREYASFQANAGPDVVGIDRHQRDADAAGNAKLLGVQSLGGRAVYAVSVQPTSKSVQLADRHTILCVDKQTFQLVQIRSSANVMTPEGKVARTDTTTVSFANVRVNQPIPDSVFAFAPPRGAKRVDPANIGAMAMGMGGAAHPR